MNAYSSTFAALLALIASLTLSLSMGGSDAGPIDLAHWLIASVSQQPIPERLQLAVDILVSIRFPRTLLAGLVGACLAMAGVLCQGLFRNGLAAPTILGTSTGGTAAAALTFYLGASHFLSIPISASLGAAVATVILLSIGARLPFWSMGTLLLAGFALNAFLGSITSLIVSLTLEKYQAAPAIMYWLLGGLSGRSWEHLAWILPGFLIGSIWALRTSPQLDVLVLGEEISRSLSLDIQTLRRSCIGATAVLVGAAVSVAGAIPFVGLVVPHITRKLVGPSHKRLLLLSAINGATLVTIADLVARLARAPKELQVGVLTALIGPPFFVGLMMKRDGSGSSDG